MARIHPLAYVDSAASIADDVEIGPYCTVGPDVTLAAGCRLIAHVNITGQTRIGERTIVYNFASLGTAPQSRGYAGEPTRLEIGADCVIRESVTMNIGTAGGGGLTKVGSRGFFMAYSHVAHDCHVGDDVVFANCATLGGHCTVGDRVFIGGLAAVHQFCRIGAGAMVGGMTGLRADLIPFGMAMGDTASLRGLNIVGMRRQGLDRPTLQIVRRAYRELFFGGGAFKERVESVARQYDEHPHVMQIIEFLRSDTRRPLCHPTAEGHADDDDRT